MTQAGCLLKILYQISGLTAPGWPCNRSILLKNESGYKVGKGIVFKAISRLIF